MRYLAFIVAVETDRDFVLAVFFVRNFIKPLDPGA
jgi:hypothetical protein